MKKIGIGFIVAGLVVVIALLARDRVVDDEVVAAPASVAAATASAPERDAPGPRSAADALPVDGTARTADAAPGTPEPAEPGSDAVRERTPESEGSSDADDSPGMAHARGGAAETEGNADAEPLAGVPAPSAGATDERPVTPGPEHAQEPDPETILRRVAEAYADVRALQAEFVQRLENPLLGSEATSRGTIYQRGSDRFLMRFEEPAGDVIVGDGEYFWIYYPSMNEAQVVRMPMERGAAGGVDLRSQFLGDPLERFDPTFRGTERIDGRRAHVLLLEPKRPVGYERLEVWVDAEDALVRRFTVREENGNVRRIRLRDLRVNPSLPDSLFEFTPPEDARVIDRG